MSEMIERIATAMCADLGEEQECIKFYHSPARAALEALRVPTEEMLRAAQEQPGQQSYADVWQSMIDAAMRG